MDWALQEVAERAAERALIVMADIPGLASCDLDELCGTLDDNDCVLVPDRRGTSTNALGLRLPFHGKTAFGHPDSLALHDRRVRELGLRTRVAGNARIAHDIDVIEDLQSLPRLAAASTEVAPKGQGW
jgi:2-phospho-L-lactate guanylyltransferase